MSRSGGAFDKFDAVGVKLSFRTNIEYVNKVMNYLNDRIDRQKTVLIYFDGDDDQSIQWESVLNIVDLYVKKHAFKDIELYKKIYKGIDGEIKINNLTNYVAHISDNENKSGNRDAENKSIDLSNHSKLFVGWNISLDDKIVELAERKTPSQEGRKTDIICRAYAPPNLWIAPMRNAALDAINKMSLKYKVSAPRARVSQEEYYREMADSRICISPFGFGELCWRDFEAILSGCLLVKPDMSYIKTLPDIFISGCTYVSVRPDYKDLEEKCAWFLENEDKRLEIVLRAEAELRGALASSWFVERFAAFLGEIHQRRSA